MYKVVEVDKKCAYGVASKILVALEDEYESKALIVEDDHCLVLKLDIGDGYKTATHWFREAVEAIPKEW